MLALSLFAVTSWAKSFSTSYLQLDIPEDWSCQKVQNDYACQPSSTSQLSKFAVLVISAKQSLPTDTLETLRMQLKAPPNTQQRTPVTSKLEWSKTLETAGETWVENLHLNREIENFYTYQLGTVARGLVILLSYSYEKSKSKDLESLVNLFRTSLQLLVAPSNSGVAPQPVGQNAALTGTPVTLKDVLSSPEGFQKKLFDPKVLGLSGILLFLVILALFKKRRG